jgi:hypothetical protein
MTTRDRLDAIAARMEAATPGPWELSDAGGPSGGMVISLAGRGRFVADMARDTDADLIAHAPTDLDAMHAALTAVLALHRPDPIYDGRMCAGETCRAPYDGAVPYPCPTVGAVESALNTKEES